MVKALWQLNLPGLSSVIRRGQCQLLAVTWLPGDPTGTGDGGWSDPAFLRGQTPPSAVDPLWAPSAAQEAAGLFWSVPGWSLGLRECPSWSPCRWGHYNSVQIGVGKGWGQSGHTRLWADPGLNQD